MAGRPSIELRRARQDDALNVAGVHLGSWRVAYRGVIPDDYLDALDVAERASRYSFELDGPDDPDTWVALTGGSVLGFVTVGPSRDGAARTGEVMALYVDPRRWRTGTGSRLMAVGEERLADCGFVRAVLWVLERNPRARAFYEAVGWRPDGETTTVELGGRELVELRYAKDLRQRDARDASPARSN